MQARTRQRAFALGERNPETLPTAGSPKSGFETEYENARGTVTWRSIRKLAQADRLPRRYI